MLGPGEDAPGPSVADWALIGLKSDTIARDELLGEISEQFAETYRLITSVN